MTTRDTTSTGYYDGPELADTILEAARAASLDPARLELDDLAELDEFHALGRPATIALADLARVWRDARVLDIGAGIGGPARVLAARYGAQVTALDATGRFCRANRALCEATGLGGQVDVVEADALAMPFGDETFDLAWTQAVLQNIADKPRLLAETRRVLRPGGRIALFEAVALDDRPLHFPVPWADDASGSFLVTAEELLESVEGAGLEVEIQNEGPAVLAEIQRAAAELPPLGGNGLDLSLLMPGYEQRMASLARNIAEQRITLIQIVGVRR